MVLTCTLLAAAVPGVASAAPNNGVRPNQGGCAPGVWVLSGPADWLDATWAGFASEGFTPEEAAELFEFDSVDDFADFIVSNVFDDPALDRNDDDLVCRSTTDPGGLPDWFFGVDDNKFHVKFVG
jgi:hypothetical protein